MYAHLSLLPVTAGRGSCLCCMGAFQAGHCQQNEQKLGKQYLTLLQLELGGTSVGSPSDLGAEYSLSGNGL